jgi:hypothetical protein
VNAKITSIHSLRGLSRSLQHLPLRVLGAPRIPTTTEQHGNTDETDDSTD